MLLTGKQKRFLRSLATQMRPIFQVGKVGVNENMIVQINEALEKRELIKVVVLRNAPDDKEVVAKELINGTGAELVQVIGNHIILYKSSTTKQVIELP